MQFRTCKNFWDSAGFSLAFIPKILTNTKATPPLLRLLDSAESQNLVKKLNKKSLLKFLLLFAFAKSRVPLNHINFNPPSKVDSQNLVTLNSCEAPENSPASWCKKSDSRLQKCNRRFFARNGESEALPLKAKKRSFLARRGSGAGGAALFAKELNEISGVRVAESSLDSTTRRIQKVRRICARFCAILALQIPLFANYVDEIFTPNKNHSINIVSENDAYFEPFIKSDKHYTGGHFISYTSPEFENSWINKIAGLSHLQDRHFTRFLISINQELYTPNKARNYDFTAPSNDILFGAGLYANLSFISRTRDFMEQFSLDLGAVGALAFGKETQNLIHKATNNPIYRGWDAPNGTLKNEALLNLHYGLIYRWVFIEDFFDVLPSFQISLGNALTAINAGAKFRVGYGIKNDFGAQKLRSRFAQNVVGSGLKVYAFFGASGSIVGRDIFIEGNSFGGVKSGVTINRFLYEIEVGAMVGWKYVSLGYVWSDESPRFKEQGTHHKYGSVRLEIMF